MAQRYKQWRNDLNNGARLILIFVSEEKLSSNKIGRDI